MMKKALSFLLILLSLLMISCGQDTEEKNGCETEKTAVLFSSLAEIWKEAGGSIDITVGETIERGFAPAGTPIVDSGAGKTINAEMLISLKPTLVICSADIPAQVSLAKMLSDSGIAVLSFHVECFEDYLYALDAMTDLTGKKDAYISATKTKSLVEKLISGEEMQKIKGTKILFFRAGSTSSSTKTKSSDEHFAAAMLSEFGCVNPADNAPISSLSIESIISSNPEYIFFSLMGDEDAAIANIKKLILSDTWSQLSAVKENKVFILPRELFHFKPCSRWGEAYNYLANIFKGEDL